MFARAPEVVPADDSLDEALEAVPAGPAVFAIWPRSGEPYLGQTAALRRRLKRLLRVREQPSRLLSLRGLAERIEYWPVGSRLEAMLVLYEVARLHLLDRYLEFLKLRMPPYLKLVLANPFPRMHLSMRISGPGLFYGPFRTRAAAEEWEHQFLDLFQLRRCQEDLEPSPGHPGCIYGEMNMCLRPCQQIVGEEEYASEVARVGEFLSTGGQSFLRIAQAARHTLSDEMQFEAAARQHKQVERIEQVLKLRDELVCDVDRLHGVAVTRAAGRSHVLLWFVLSGVWQRPVEFPTELAAESPPMDQRLKQLTASLSPESVSAPERQEHLAILARWFYSSWRDGEWIPFDSPDRVPYRRLVNAISRTAKVQV